MIPRNFIYLTFLCIWGCAIEIKNSEIRFLDSTEDNRYVSTRVNIKDTNYQKNIFDNKTNFKFFFLDHIAHPYQEPTNKWKNQKLNILFTYNDDFVKEYKDRFEFQKIQDFYAELILKPNHFHLSDDFNEKYIFIFLMFDHLSRYYSYNRSLIGFPLNVELRVSIFKKNKEIASCQLKVKENVFTNEFLEFELRDKESLFHQLKNDRRINLKPGNLFTDKIIICLDKLKINNLE
ncbi:hypothetical protein EHQ82_05595 [Leptospira selangorensis]|uniref:Lipoprotein n=1 Tax=Leptospira selangorensis TaxID=2484982 RepID=A0ABY2NFP5_9LEPT|nr:hypothetical protein [Leptospira selangorensis]TGM23488.1 hypothetical protein EHQ82_05595 [Leptospira selangorensis]